MPRCKGCDGEIDPRGVPRYDVLNPDYDPATRPMDPTVGPYCEGCWPATYTGGLTA